jgi:hypothetical protein
LHLPLPSSVGRLTLVGLKTPSKRSSYSPSRHTVGE